MAAILPLQSARAYEINGQPADAASFTRVACDPARSVAVEACAGSGKTWLLVARMLRLLLAGAEPSELLAITFTRKAAQEMRDRLIHLLRELALGSDFTVVALLEERGIEASEATRLMPQARLLYERVLSSPSHLSIDTFHSWFARLIQIAPLTAGVPHGYALAESTGELLNETYLRLMQSLNQADNRHIKEALLRLYDQVGDTNTRKLLDSFVSKRAEWWAAGRAGDPMSWLRELCGQDGQRDARLALWEDPALTARIAAVASLLGQGTPTNQKRATRIEMALTFGSSVQSFDAIYEEFCDDKGTPRGNNHRRGKLLQAIEAHPVYISADGFESECADIATELKQLRKRSCEPGVLALNEALFIVGEAFLERYQALKGERRVIDFSDLEWHAYRLLCDDNHAAYLHSRLDARYRHILLDEFQDTNPLQWSIVRAWLRAYGDDGSKPSLFVVGDPKQSIYRFRRAEPRVFAAACSLIAADGGDVLRTNQTRRNARAVVGLLNAGFAGNRLFPSQTTVSEREGAVWRLPLVRREEPQDGQPADDESIDMADDSAGEAAEMPEGLRDPLTTPREEEEDVRRLEEGRAVAAALIHAAQDPQRQQALRWSDVMLLVKKRRHLSAYEAALREAGIPFVSDKRGGLLESLEVADMIALLTFLITPADDRALAHVLKSPVAGATDADLVILAQRREAGWWGRLDAAVADPDGGASPELDRAARLLSGWLHVAPMLPVHDLLDRIMHEGSLMTRYAQAAAPAARTKTLGNLNAFIELALSLDAGRYPSLPKFIDELRTLQRDAQEDAPDEASIDAAADAVRILTIHGAKGLEAQVVVLLDANHSESARDDAGILCEWPQESDAPSHFSAFGRSSERGAARDALFDSEEVFREQENWNLLYVAVTRAKELLIVSGVAAERNALPDGTCDGSWYARLQMAERVDFGRPTGALAAAMDSEFPLAVFDPSPLPNDKGDAQHRAAGTAIDEGIALHAVLERLTSASEWPIAVPDALSIARWIRCTTALASTVREQAALILSQPSLERFFNPALFRAAHNELEIIVDGGVQRLDRIVVCNDTVWILDYKRNLLDGEVSDYRAQLARYRAAVQAVFTDMEVKSVLITADGRLWEMD